MQFNSEKCEVFPITKKCSPIITNYNINGTELSTVKSAKYLGV